MLAKTIADYDALEERDRVGKYSLDKIESYFLLCELVLTPRSNPLLAVEDLYLAKQGSMTSGEFHSHILKIVKRCQFPNQEAEEQAVRDAIFMGINSPRARDMAINLMNEEGKQVTVEFLLNHLAVEDGNTQHKFLSQLHALATGSATVNLSWAYSGFNSTSLLFGMGCVDGSGSLSAGAFNQLKLVTLSVI